MIPHGRSDIGYAHMIPMVMLGGQIPKTHMIPHGSSYRIRTYDTNEGYIPKTHMIPHGRSDPQSTHIVCHVRSDPADRIRTYDINGNVGRSDPQNTYDTSRQLISDTHL